jgi:hypothetical protein
MITTYVIKMGRSEAEWKRTIGVANGRTRTLESSGVTYLSQLVRITVKATFILEWLSD